MKKYIDVMKKSIELSETILEGFQYIQRLLSEGKGEQTVFLFEDVLVAYATIGKTIEPALNKMKNEGFATLQADFVKAIDLVITAYEEKNIFKVQEILQFTLVPQFKKLKGELEKAFQSYTIS